MKKSLFSMVLVPLSVVIWTSGAASAGGVMHLVSPGEGEQNWKQCAHTGYLDFEDKYDELVLGEEIPGVVFTTTEGQDWLVGAWSAGGYNGKCPSGDYTSEGDKWAWLGRSQGSGIITFSEGSAGYFSCHTSTYSGLVVDAYDEDGLLVDSSGWATRNTNTGTMDLLWVERADKDIAYVVVHDTGNYWLIDTICTDAPGVGVITVVVDIKPNHEPNSINPTSMGVIPVAILTTSVEDGEEFDFDATQVDSTTVQFGPDGASIAHTVGHIEDVDDDGDLDLMLHFRARETGIACGDTSATLTGETFDGDAIAGEDSVNTVGCK